MWWQWVILYYLLAGAVNLIVLAWDKRAAVKARRRVPERVLHLMELVGGILGSLLGQHLLRHKTRKFKFRVLSWSIGMLHLAFWTWVLWLISGGDTA